MLFEDGGREGETAGEIMSHLSGAGGGGGRRTRSDTLKLQRLIEVLKERGSDLGGSLESSASDFLADVRPKRGEEGNRCEIHLPPLFAKKKKKEKQ